jgi:signal transduction histidine kinase
VLPLVYPLWSWRRLHAATRYLQHEMQRLQQENLPLLAPLPTSGDFLDRRMDAVEQATQQLRELHRFVSESLEQLPSPILVCSPAGAVVLANAAARTYIHSTGATALQGCHAANLLQHLRSPTDQQPLLSAEALTQGCVPAHSEGQDAQGRSLLLQCQPFARTDRPNGVAGHAGWLLTLVDLSDIRRALALRDQALNFISHDIRAPNTSILTLLEMQRTGPEPLGAPELLARIERYAQASLGMAESFVQLASAQSQPMAHNTFDLVSMLEETIDDAWVLARQQRVTVRTRSAPEVATCHGDRTLLRRALANVIHNALKYSPPESQVQCSISARDTHWVVSVRDQGPGIPLEQQARLCTPFARLHTRSHPGIGGIGLGLALVQTVLQRHGGTLEINSQPGEGAQFSLVLPQAGVLPD